MLNQLCIPTIRKPAAMAQTTKTLSGADFLKTEQEEFAALSRDELVHLVFRCQSLLRAINQYMTNSSQTTTTAVATNDSSSSFDIYQSVADYLQIKTQDIAALSKDELEQLVLRGQDIMRRSPIKPGCRFFEALPDEFILEILLTWLDIKELARFDVALLNRMDRSFETRSTKECSA